MKTVQQKYKKNMFLNKFLKNSKGISPVFGIIILLATGTAVSLTAVTWERSLAYSLMVVEQLEITGLQFYDGQDSPFPGLPEVHVTGQGGYVVIDEPSNITISGSSNNVIVMGGTYNIRLLGGHNNLTLLNSGQILIDVTNPNILLTEVPGGWILQATNPSGRPVIRGDIYLNTLGSVTNTVYIQGGQVVQCDSSYYGSAVAVRNTGTCTVTIVGISLQGVVCAKGEPIPCTIQPNTEATIGISFDWIASTIYRVSLFTSRANIFVYSQIAW